MSQIASIIQQLSGTSSPYLKVCQVTAVDRTARTVDCEPLDESAPLLGCNLQGDQEGEEGLVLFPKVGSIVLVGLVEGADTGAVLLTDELDDLELHIGKMSFSVSAEGISFNEGKLGGLVKIETLTKRLNTIEQDINELKQALTTWIPSLGDGGTALKGVITSWAGKPLTRTKRTDYEDEKVKH